MGRGIRAKLFELGSTARRTAVNHPHTILQSIFRSGLIVALPAELPLQSITKVSDALLASPIVAVLLPWRKGVEALLNDLRRRSGPHLAVGVSGIETAVQPHHLRHAHFVIAERYDPTAQQAVSETGLAYVPKVASPAEALDLNVAAVVVACFSENGRMLTRTLLRNPDSPPVMVEGAFSTDDATFYARLGASAMIVHRTIYEDDEQLMADLITQARRMQTAWDVGWSDRVMG